MYKHATGKSHVSKCFKTSKDRSHRQIRAALVAAMRKHSTLFEHVWDQRMSDDSRTVKPFSEYLDALEKEGSWGGFLEVHAFAKVQKFNVLVIDADIHKAFRFEGGDDASPYVVLKFAAKHYEWVKCNSAATCIPVDRSGRTRNQGSSRSGQAGAQHPCETAMQTGFEHSFVIVAFVQFSVKCQAHKQP